MAVKEHFSMELLESQKRREGVTMRFDESASWKNLSLNGTFGLMRGFMAGRLPAADVFDVELMTRFIAVAEVWRTHHTLAWHKHALLLQSSHRSSRADRVRWKPSGRMGAPHGNRSHSSAPGRAWEDRKNAPELPDTARPELGGHRRRSLCALRIASRRSEHAVSRTPSSPTFAAIAKSQASDS